METQRSTRQTQHLQLIDEGSIDPERSCEFAEAFCSRGRARGMLDDDAGALADFNRAVELDPECAEAYLFRGLQKDIRGDHTAAAADYAKAQELISRQAVVQPLQTASAQ